MAQSFKQFNAFVNASDEDLAALSEEQLQEIFGIFKNNQKFDQAQAQRDKLKAAMDAKKKAAAAKKDEIWKKAKERVEAENGGFSTAERGSGTFRSQAAMGRSAELDWVRNATSESAHWVLDALEEGLKAIHQVFHEPVGQDEREVSRVLKEAVKRFNKKSEDHLLEATVSLDKDVNDTSYFVVKRGEKVLGHVWKEGAGWAAEMNKGGKSWDMIGTKSDAVNMLVDHS
jgi:hypothetical protein